MLNMGKDIFINNADFSTNALNNPLMILNSVDFVVGKTYSYSGGKVKLSTNYPDRCCFTFICDDNLKTKISMVIKEGYQYVFGVMHDGEF